MSLARKSVDEDHIYGTTSSVDVGNLFWSAFYVVATGALVLFAAHEGGKCVTCWHQVQSALNPASEYTEKPLCTDSYEIARYGRFSEQGCTMARETLQLGEYGGVAACYWRNSVVHNVFTFQDVRVTLLVAGTLLCSLYWALSQYRQHQTEKAAIAANERMALQMHAQVLQLQRKSWGEPKSMSQYIQAGR